MGMKQILTKLMSKEIEVIGSDQFTQEKKKDSSVNHNTKNMVLIRQ